MFRKAEPANDGNKIQINLNMNIRLEKQIHLRYHDAKWPDRRYVDLAS